MSTAERFFAKVDVGDCWVWTGAKADGYGTFHHDGSLVKAHRWCYEHLVGPIPHDRELDHLCRNRACVNPDHVEVVTHRENVLRGYGIAAREARQTHCIRGHKFTPENTMPQSQGRRGRRCRECKRIDHREYKARKRATSPEWRKKQAEYMREYGQRRRAMEKVAS